MEKPLMRLRRALGTAMAAVIACLLLGLIVYMAGSLGRSSPRYSTIPSDDPRVRQMAEAAARQRARPAVPRYSLASVPWVRNPGSPEPVEVPLPALPYARARDPQRPLAVHLYAARMPPIGRRYSLRNPDPVALPLAAVPWSQSRPAGAAAHVAAAALPRLPRMREVRQPDEVLLPVAGAPWNSVLPGLPEDAELRLAGVPWVADRAGAEAQVPAAQVPAFRAKRDPKQPHPAAVPAAQVPWARNPDRPQAVHVYEARMSSRLSLLKPGAP
jgi:hypothetical protein